MTQDEQSILPDAAILIVDDEEPILRAIHRTLRREGFVIHTAQSGAEALEILSAKDIAVILCDQRMPEMSGAEVLAEAYKTSPDTYRVTLTGYADLTAAQQSINEGRVNQFLTKPWNDAHLATVVREGVKSHGMIRENRRLQELTHQQNQQLASWNQKLGVMVHQRTEQLQSQNDQLTHLQEQLSSSLHDTVAVLAGLLEAYDPSLGIHAKRVAEVACIICDRFGIQEQAKQQIKFAAYLHDIGMISRLNKPDHGRSVQRGSGPHRKQATPPESGWALLSRVRGFEEVARAVRHQQERFDGTGKPDGLGGERIPLASRMIAVCNAYDKALYSSTRPTEVATDAARDALTREKGKAFDPALVEALLACLDETPDLLFSDLEVELSPKQLCGGMRLSRDLSNINGVLLLKEGTTVTTDLISRLRKLGRDQMLVSGVFVQSTKTDGEPSDLSIPTRRSA